VSAPNESAATASPAIVGRVLADGRRIYRLVTALVVWWAWVVFAAASAGDLVVQGHDFLSLKFGLGLLTVTGLVFACTLWPKVIADDNGLVVRNPIRSFDIPWGAVRGIFLADSVEIQCARGPGKKDKTVYCWALSAARRGRAKARLHGWQVEHGKRPASQAYGKLPTQAQELAKMPSAEVMAREMARMSEEAKTRLGRPARSGSQDMAAASVNGSSPAETGGNSGADGHRAGGDPPDSGGVTVRSGDTLTGTWAWPALGAFLVPGIAFAIAMLAG
jgi:hypothetical protein